MNKQDQVQFRIEDAALSFGSVSILRSLSLNLHPGELTVIIGPNGAGKSTFLKMVSGDFAPTTGRILFEGIPLPSWSASGLAQRRAVMPQSSQLAFPFTVLEVVRLGASVSSSSLAQANQRSLEALERVDLLDKAAHSFQVLSGGEQQRAQLARTLCQVWKPVGPQGANFLFLDEPISNLDIRHQIDLLEKAQDYVHQGGGCIAVLHDLNIAAMFADRLLVFHDGTITVDGPPSEILTNQLIAEVFDVPIKVNCPPRCPIPFILPQSLVEPR